jgi:hypothetical protein
MSEPLETPENELPEQEDATEDQIAKKLFEMCEEYNLSHAVFLSFDGEKPLMWYKGQKLSAARLTANFTRIVKEDIMKDLDT